MLKTFEEMCNDESICKYCYQTDYGENSFGTYPGGYYSCEGMFCKESYDSYLDENDTTEAIVNYASKVRRIENE